MSQTVASDDYKHLKFADLIEPNFNWGDAYWRAIKVFIISFAGYDQLCPELYLIKFEEYKNAMKTLYSINTDDSQINYFQMARNQLKNEGLFAAVGIKRAKGLCDYDGVPKAQNIRVRAFIATSEMGEDFLNMGSEEQSSLFGIRMSYDQLIDCRTNNRSISCKLVCDDWLDFSNLKVVPYSDDWLQLKDFSITFSEISAEGFEDWFDFGRGIQILIKIEIQVQNHSEYDSIFHFHTIFGVLFDRIRVYDEQMTTIDRLHKYSAHKSKISYIRKRVDPNSEMAFWSTATTSQQILQRISTKIIETESYYRESEIRQILRVQYCDLQISQLFLHDYEDTVCLCSEWCNFNAFFHFNPIYRCLLVNHSQLYLNNRTKVPEMFLFCSTSMLDYIQRMTPPGYVPFKVPVLQLISQANKLREINYMRYFMTDIGWRKLYDEDSKPLYENLIGMTHKILMTNRLIPSTIIQSATDPFADICCDNIIDYFKVLSDLHSFISMLRTFVDELNIHKWFLELDRKSRKEYGIYIITGYLTKISKWSTVYDFLFTEDYEYSNVFFGDTDDHKYVKNCRDSVYRFGEPKNPLNIRVILEPSVEAFVTVYKFIHKVDPKLPIARTFVALQDMFNLCQGLDQEMFESSVKFNFHFQSLPSDNSEEIQILMQRYTALYTLKLYSMNFGFQKYFITSFIKYNKLSIGFGSQVCQQYDYIWDFETIENSLRSFYNQILFDIPNNIQMNIEDFYDVFWGQPEHEFNLGMFSTYDECIDSALYEYRRLYFWWRNNGDNRQRFQTILEVFVGNLEFLSNRSRKINSFYILNAILDIQEYEYRREVMDDLVYYLIRALCSMILVNISQFMNGLHDLQLENLVEEHCSFTLTKPGWVPLFKTMRQTFKRLNQLKPHFNIFEHQNNRIENTFSQTRKLIKDIYRQFYKKLLIEWQKELDKMYCDPYEHQNKDYFLPLHLASGTSFMVAFINDFRKDCVKARKACRTLLTTKNPQTNHQEVFIMCVQAYEDYLSDHNAIRKAKPFLEDIWQTVLQQFFHETDQMTAELLNIDLNEADLLH